jgi:hypothetical protein
MGKVKEALPAALIAGITFREEVFFSQVMDILVEEFGPIEMGSPVFDFSMTDYYTKEMGTDLRKQFFCFERPLELEMLPEIKLRTNKIELRFVSGEGDIAARRVNIDPGYVTLSKLVLATTKDYSHRIYIGKGIYAETTLRFLGGSFKPLDITYPDYRTPLAITFFNSVREFVKKNRYIWTPGKE